MNTMIQMKTYLYFYLREKRKIRKFLIWILNFMGIKLWFISYPLRIFRKYNYKIMYFFADIEDRWQATSDRRLVTGDRKQETGNKQQATLKFPVTSALTSVPMNDSSRQSRPAFSRYIYEMYLSKRFVSLR